MDHKIKINPDTGQITESDIVSIEINPRRSNNNGCDIDSTTDSPLSSLLSTKDVAPQDPLLRSQEDLRLELSKCMSDESGLTVKIEQADELFAFKEEGLTSNGRLEEGDTSENGDPDPVYFGHSVFDSADVKMEYDYSFSSNPPIDKEDVNFVPPAPPASRYPCLVEGCSWLPIKNKPTSSVLRSHFLRTHLQNSPYACPVPCCKVTSTSLSSYEEHLNRHLLKKRIWSCEKCGARLTKRAFRKHKCLLMRLRNPKSVRGCTLDEMIGYLKTHYSNLESKEILCKISPEEDKNNDFRPSEGDPLGIKRMEERINLEAILKRDPVFIQTCKENPGFEELVLSNQARIKNKSLQSYDFHQMKVQAPSPFQCSVCKRDYKKEGLLQKHLKYFDCAMELAYMRRLEESLRWACTKCGEELINPAEMRLHWSKAHQVRIPRNRRNYKAAEVVVVEVEKHDGEDFNLDNLTVKKQNNNLKKSFDNAKPEEESEAPTRRFSKRKRKLKKVFGENEERDLDVKLINRDRGKLEPSRRLRKRSSKYQCPHCGKSYPSQRYLDWHLSKIHTPHRIPRSRRKVEDDVEVEVEQEEHELVDEEVEVDMRDLFPIVEVETETVEMIVPDVNVWEMEPLSDNLEVMGSSNWSCIEIGPVKVETETGSYLVDDHTGSGSGQTLKGPY